eukprot:TRINITY_DN7732_c0_g1_i1.p1 TRINITY_DN7732_c0_g1~~TRINITY_DN7732_c0_g1_i1.p1  ORF type:complete len:665 (+),score=251.84 TRINITY_DN7732_c0_g1_i1:90-1997(+)
MAAAAASPPSTGQAASGTWEGERPPVTCAEHFAALYGAACARAGVPPHAIECDDAQGHVCALGRGFSAAHAGACAEAIRAVREFLPVRRLEVRDSWLGCPGAAKLCAALADTAAAPLELVLSGANLGREGAHAVAQLLRRAPVRELCLEWNALGEAASGWDDLCDAIGTAPALEKLDLRSNRISERGVSGLARGLRGSASLSDVDLRWNALAPSGGRQLLAAVEGSQSLTRLALAGNSIDYAVVRRVDAHLRANALRPSPGPGATGAAGRAAEAAAQRVARALSASPQPPPEHPAPHPAAYPQSPPRLVPPCKRELLEAEAERLRVELCDARQRTEERREAVRRHAERQRELRRRLRDANAWRLAASTRLAALRDSAAEAQGAAQQRQAAIELLEAKGASCAAELQALLVLPDGRTLGDAADALQQEWADRAALAQREHAARRAELRAEHDRQLQRLADEGDGGAACRLARERASTAAVQAELSELSEARERLLEEEAARTAGLRQQLEQRLAERRELQGRVAEAEARVAAAEEAAEAALREKEAALARERAGALRLTAQQAWQESVLTESERQRRLASEEQVQMQMCALQRENEKLEQRRADLTREQPWYERALGRCVEDLAAHRLDGRPTPAG